MELRIYAVSARALTFFAFLIPSMAATAADEREGPVPDWKEVIFDGRTRYSDAPDCIRAVSDSAASGLVRRRDVNLEETPLLAWRWRAEAPLTGADADEQSEAGDDFLARVYVVREGFFPWQSRAINYVWSREVPEGEHWPNPFLKQAIMVAVQSGNQDSDAWHSFRRNVRADFRRFHDMDPDTVHAVAVMTDTDNTDGRAEACYELPGFRAE